MQILSIENFHTWSWSGIFNAIIERLEKNGYEFHRLLREKRDNIEGLESKVDLILCQNVDSLSIPDHKEKIVCRIGGIAMPEGINEDTCHQYDELLSQVNTVISTNSALHRIASRNNKHSYIIPNGVDLKYFRLSKTRVGKPFTIGFAGNILTSSYMDYKGYPLVVSAHCALIGDVALKLAFYQHNQIPHNKMVEDFYSQIDCLVSASKGEGCSNVIAEALACGIPVILTQVGYHGENLVHAYDCLFVNRTAESIEDAVRFLMEDPELWLTLSTNGRKFAEINHDVDFIATAYENIFQGAFERLS